MRRRLPAILIIVTSTWLFLHTWQSVTVHENYVLSSTTTTAGAQAGLSIARRNQADGKFQELPSRHSAHQDKGIGRSKLAGSGEGRIREREQESADEGYSRLQEMARRVQRDGVVIMVMGSKGYLDMLQNWALSLSVIGLGSNFIVFAQDEETERFCSLYWPDQVIRYKLTGLDGVPAGIALANDSLVYGSKTFFYMQIQRPLYIRLLLRLNYSVLLSDIDMFWVSSPLPYLSQSLPFDLFLTADDRVMFGPSWDDDVAHPLQQHYGPQFGRKKFGCILCTCFLLFRPTDKALSLLDEWIGSLLGKGYSKEVHSLQNHFNIVIQGMVERGTDVRIGLLPPQRFPSGIVAFQPRRMGGREMVVVHANYVYGRMNKVKRLRKAGVWKVGWEEEGEGKTAMERISQKILVV